MHDARVRPSLIFDLDGTLVDSIKGISDSLNRALNAAGLPTHSESVVKTFVGNGLRTTIKRAAPNAQDAQLDALLQRFQKDYEDTWSQGTRPFTGITQMLMELQRNGHQLAVLSNKGHAFTQTIAREVFPSIHFTAVEGQQENIPHKPHPFGANKIAASMGRNPHDCILVGDSVADVETADNAEMEFIGVTWGYQNRIRLMEAGAERFIDTPSSLSDVMAELEEDEPAY